MTSKSDNLLIEYAVEMAKLRRVKKAIDILVYVPGFTDATIDITKYRDSYYETEGNCEWKGWVAAIEDWIDSEGVDVILNEKILAWLLDKKKTIRSSIGQKRRNIFAHGESLRKRIK